MTPEQVVQQIKSTAFNKIRKMYHPKYKFPYNWGSHLSPADQRDEAIRSILGQMDRDLQKLKSKKQNT